MKLTNGKIIAEGWVPTDLFVGKVSVSSDCDDIERELRCFQRALNLISEGAKLFPPASPFLGVNVYFVSDNTVAFAIDEEALGQYNSLILFPLKRLRKYVYSEWSIMLIMIEELAHAIWQIPDGPQIEVRMSELFRAMGFDVTYSEFLAILLLEEEGNLKP